MNISQTFSVYSGKGELESFKTLEHLYAFFYTFWTDINIRLAWISEHSHVRLYRLPSSSTIKQPC